MQTLESLRRRIENTEDMQSVVTTMKTLAAVSIRQYEAAVEALADYDRTIELGFQILAREHVPHMLQQRDGAQRSGAIVFGSDQGMCGQFNDEIASYFVEALERDSADWPCVVIGSRARTRIEEAGRRVNASFEVPTSAGNITNLLQDLVPHVEMWRAEEQIETMWVFFNRRTSAASYRPHRHRLLPLRRQQFLQWRETPWPSRSLPAMTIDWRVLLSRLVRQYLFVSLFRACAESLAAENASRIASMQSAEKNIEERLAELHTQFNQLRQDSITEELLDVITGYEALRRSRR